MQKEKIIVNKCGICNKPLYKDSICFFLKRKRKGQYAIDIDGRRSSYRLILKPIDENLTDIYANAKSVEIIMVWEVSKHYE